MCIRDSVLLDERGKVLRPCIMWNDQRNYRQCLYAIERLGGLKNIVKLINNGIMPGFTVGKILWVMENEPHIFAKARKFLNPKDYIRFKLTGPSKLCILIGTSGVVGLTVDEFFENGEGIL